MNTTAWVAKFLPTAALVAKFLTGMETEWNALHTKVVIAPKGFWVFYPIPFPGKKV